MTAKKPARVTDKEILEWIYAGGKFNATLERDWWVAYDKYGVQHGRRHARMAIKAAMAAERRKK